MQCFHPIFLRDQGITVPCQKCFACQSNRRKDWVFRIKEEMKSSIASYTVTLTYDDSCLPALELYDPYKSKDDSITDIMDQSRTFLIDEPFCDDASILPGQFYYHPFSIRDVQLFLKRLRKKWKFRYFGVGEYGGEHARPHFHIIFFFRENPPSRNKFEIACYKIWDKCLRITVDSTDDRCIEYTLKYCLKNQYINQPSPKIFLSKRPYIGSSYMSDSIREYHLNRKDDFTDAHGFRQRLPSIYRRIYPAVFLDRNSDACQEDAFNLEIEDRNKAHELGITYNSLIARRRSDFTKKCIKQIKDNKL